MILEEPYKNLKEYKEFMLALDDWRINPSNHKIDKIIVLRRAFRIAFLKMAKAELQRIEDYLEIVNFYPTNKRYLELVKRRGETVEKRHLTRFIP